MRGPGLYVEGAGFERSQIFSTHLYKKFYLNSSNRRNYEPEKSMKFIWRNNYKMENPLLCLDCPSEQTYVMIKIYFIKFTFLVPSNVLYFYLFFLLL